MKEIGKYFINFLIFKTFVFNKSSVNCLNSTIDMNIVHSFNDLDLIIISKYIYKSK